MRQFFFFRLFTVKREQTFEFFVKIGAEKKTNEVLDLFFLLTHLPVLKSTNRISCGGEKKKKEEKKKEDLIQLD